MAPPPDAEIRPMATIESTPFRCPPNGSSPLTPIAQVADALASLCRRRNGLNACLLILWKVLAAKVQVLRAGEIQIGKARIDPFHAIDGAVDTAELVAGDRHPVQEMPGSMGLDHDKAEPRRHVAEQHERCCR